jgi:hypothetical protein
VFSADGQALATSNNFTFRAWGLGRGVVLEGQSINRCGFLPDGRLLTFSRHDGTVRIWPPELLRA